MNEYQKCLYHLEQAGKELTKIYSTSAGHETIVIESLLEELVIVKRKIGRSYDASKENE